MKNLVQAMSGKNMSVQLTRYIGGRLLTMGLVVTATCFTAMAASPASNKEPDPPRRTDQKMPDNVQGASISIVKDKSRRRSLSFRTLMTD